MKKLSRSRPFHLGVYLFLRCVAALVGLGPLSWARSKGRALGWLYRSIDRKHYLRTVEHLCLAFPQKGREQITSLAIENYISIGTSLVELFSLHKIYKKYNGAPQFIGKELLDDALAQGKGVIVATGHMGNWELTGLLSALAGLPFHAIARPIDNPYIEKWMEKIRHKFGGTIISKWGAVKGSLKALKRGELVTVLMDQDAGSDGMMVPFFKRPASTIPLVPLLSQRTGAPIFIAWGRREKDGSTTVVIEKTIELVPAEDRREVLEKTTALCTAALEEIIRNNPSCWLWMHRRWKTQASADE